MSERSERAKREIGVFRTVPTTPLRKKMRLVKPATVSNFERQKTL